MKTTQNNIELIKITTVSKCDSYMVKAEGKVIGFLDKYRNTKTETHPWKAFAAKYNADVKGFQYAGEIFFECFYGPTAKAEAIVALINRAAL